MSTKQMYDLIGDIHGHADELEILLEKIGYHQVDGVYRNPGRKVIFLGDFVDRGPHQRRTLDIVRPMIESGAAYSVMGNHEYNAIAYYTSGTDGEFLRKRDDKNTGQHQAFLDEFAHQPDEWADAIAWFKTLPLWLEIEGLRVIHACWDPAAIDRIWDYQNGSNLLGDELLHTSSDHSNWQHEAIETLLKGKEIPLPPGNSFEDKDGNHRHEIRVRWWDDAKTYRDAYFGPEHARTHIPDDPITGDHLIEYGHGEKPVFLGHYWLEGEPTRLAANIACLDYSVAKDHGKLVAYRWDGEREINPSKFVAVARAATGRAHRQHSLRMIEGEAKNVVSAHAEPHQMGLVDLQRVEHAEKVGERDVDAVPLTAAFSQKKTLIDGRAMLERGVCFGNSPLWQPCFA